MYIATNSVCSFFCESVNQSWNFLLSPLWVLRYFGLMVLVIISIFTMPWCPLGPPHFTYRKRILTGCRYHWPTSFWTLFYRNLQCPNINRSVKMWKMDAIQDYCSDCSKSMSRDMAEFGFVSMQGLWERTYAMG